uniref:Fibrinolytic enzyme 2 (Fragments) n=1 Tax=Hediste japonica TaxID=73376 RepID=FIBR2_HEDJA|nr:RecName: Full=Fibrinolytic enzyme 2; Short=NJF-2 [Hediste japonica]
ISGTSMSCPHVAGRAYVLDTSLRVYLLDTGLR